jgi:hypothetical protein
MSRSNFEKNSANLEFLGKFQFEMGDFGPESAKFSLSTP